MEGRSPALVPHQATILKMTFENAPIIEYTIRSMRARRKATAPCEEVPFCHRWSNLPLDLVVGIMSFLDGIDVVRCTQTCRIWRRLNLHSPLWRELRQSTANSAIFPERQSDREAVVRMARLSTGFAIARTPPSDPNLDTTFRIVITGAGGSGTSSLVDRFHLNTWPSVRPSHSDLTLRVFSFTHWHSTQSVKVKLVDICDSVRPSPFPNTKLWSSSTALLVSLDLTDLSSVDRAKLIIDKIRRYLPGLFDSMPIALVGCKADAVDREVTQMDLEDFVQQYEVPYFETSAKTGAAVDAPFLYVLKRLSHVVA